MGAAAFKQRPGGGPCSARRRLLFMGCKGVGGSNGCSDGSSDSGSDVGSGGGGWKNRFDIVVVFFCFFFFLSIPLLRIAPRRYWRLRRLVKLLKTEDSQLCGFEINGNSRVVDAIPYRFGRACSLGARVSVAIVATVRGASRKP